MARCPSAARAAAHTTPTTCASSPRIRTGTRIHATVLAVRPVTPAPPQQCPHQRRRPSNRRRHQWPEHLQKGLLRDPGEPSACASLPAPPRHKLRGPLLLPLPSRRVPAYPLGRPPRLSARSATCAPRRRAGALQRHTRFSQGPTLKAAAASATTWAAAGTTSARCTRRCAVKHRTANAARAARGERTAASATCLGTTVPPQTASTAGPVCAPTQ